MQHCDHCDLPLFDTPIPGKDDDAQYCCYGCQMLDETVGADAVDENDATLAPLLQRTVIGGLLAGFTMVLSLAISSEYGFAALRNLEHAVGTAHLVLVLTAAPALILLGTPVVRAAWNTLRQGRLSLHLLFAMGTSAAVLVSLLSYVRGTGPVYLETAVMLLALYTLGRYLTARSKHRARRVLGALLTVPDTTYQRLCPEPGEVPPDALRPDDRIRLHAGDVVPADGVVVSGRSFVDTRQLTGESTPIATSEGDRCFAGTQVVDGTLELRVTATGADRRLHQIEETMRAAMAQPSRLAKRTERIMRVLIPGVIALALIAFGGWWWMAGAEKALYVALSVV
ncbi:MAG: heavy metal translocating P-type ATPase, partial [Bacteroidota bacterium]